MGSSRLHRQCKDSDIIISAEFHRLPEICNIGQCTWRSCRDVIIVTGGGRDPGPRLVNLAEYRMFAVLTVEYGQFRLVDNLVESAFMLSNPLCRLDCEYRCMTTPS